MRRPATSLGPSAGRNTAESTSAPGAPTCAESAGRRSHRMRRPGPARSRICSARSAIPRPRATSTPSQSGSAPSSSVRPRCEKRPSQIASARARSRWSCSITQKTGRGRSARARSSDDLLNRDPPARALDMYHVPEQVGEPLREPVAVERPANRCRAGLRQAAGQRRIAGQPQQRVGDGLRVVGRDEQAVYAVLRPAPGYRRCRS